MTSPTHEPQTKSRRRWFQFSLRTLLIVVTLVSVFLAWYVPKYRQAQRHRAAIAWVEEVGKGGVESEDVEERPWWKIWGDWNKVKVKYVVLFDGGNLNDLRPLKEFTHLEYLFCESSQVVDLTPLKYLTKLEDLEIYHSKVSDLTPLKGLTNLKSLFLDDTQVIDLTPLEGLTQLEQLGLDNTQVSDLTPLQGLAHLKELHLQNTQVSDLTPLAKLKNLKEIYLYKTKASKDQLQMLKQALPNCLFELSQTF